MMRSMAPSVVVLAIGAPDLIRQPSHPEGEGPMDLLRIGWRDGPIPAGSFRERVDRWLRTVWPLYRFREFTREAILDRVLGRPDPGPPPQDFTTRAALFAQLYGERAEAVQAAFRVWEWRPETARPHLRPSTRLSEQAQRPSPQARSCPMR